MLSYRLVSLFGLFFLLVLAWLAARERKPVNFRLIFTGLLVQWVFAFIVFRLPSGVVIFSWLNDGVLRLISFAKEGLYFLFGPLAVS
ncbi:MAG: hypothetical protein AMK69_19580, partial [Nitrospira bacterium SG8_3]